MIKKLNELSNSKLNAYLDKASESEKEARKKHTDAKLDKDEMGADKAKKLAAKRMKGMTKAAEKMSESEVIVEKKYETKPGHYVAYGDDGTIISGPHKSEVEAHAAKKAEKGAHDYGRMVVTNHSGLDRLKGKGFHENENTEDDSINEDVTETEVVENETIEEDKINDLWPLIEYALDGKPFEFKKIFEKIMSEKIQEIIEAKRIDVSTEMFNIKEVA